MAEAPVPIEVRRERILSLVRGEEFVRVSDLSERFGISEVTIRSDLDALAGAGALRRVHGGAIAAEPVREPSFEEALGANAAAKRSIGQAAAAMVQSGDTVVVDVGTTAGALAVALVERRDLTDVTVVTSALNIAMTLEAAIPRFTVIVTGGTLRPLQHSLVDPMADAILSQLHATIGFVGCNGVHPEAGVTNVNIPEAAVKRRILAASAVRVVIADGSKIGQVSVARLCDLADVDRLCTDASADPAVLTEIEEAGVAVEVAA